MIRIPHPNMALNSPDVFEYKMQNTRLVAADVSPYWLANNVAAVATGNKLAALVINCHGFVDDKSGKFVGLALGTGIYLADLKHFKQLNALVDAIYITSCRAAAGTAGKMFCGELARRTQAIVYAGDVDQRVGFGSAQALFKGDVIDDYEGQLFRFGKSGEGVPYTMPK